MGLLSSESNERIYASTQSPDAAHGGLMLRARGGSGGTAIPNTVHFQARCADQKYAFLTDLNLFN